MPKRRLEVVILAAGLGTRMKSKTIKVLHAAAGRPIVDYVLDLAEEISDEKPIMVVGYQSGAVKEHCGARAEYALQEKQLGTGHAVLQAAELLRSRGAGNDSMVLVLSGDVPLTRAETLRALLDTHHQEKNAVTLLSMCLEDPAMYGRIVRETDGSVARIVEARDATREELAISEVNSGIYVFDTGLLLDALASLSSDNAQGEYYLTDVIAAARRRDQRVGAVIIDPIEALGVNSRAELAAVEAELNRRKIETLMIEGVTFRDPSSASVDWNVRIGRDTIIYPYVCLEGSTSIGEECVIESGSHLVDSEIGNGVRVLTGTVATESNVADGAAVGPYAHLRPGSRLGVHVKVGNFVETKKAVFGEGSKASHLSYIGDAEVGAGVNIGAGTITCNYDGVHKHKTVLEDGVFIGSDTQLVAPVRVGKGAYVGAGSTITKDVPPDALALSRTPQKVIPGWASEKQKKEKG
ncbi:MAG: bifunctional UDP-N-acetylglucosamine diphosphorylase/glucosamine-1-phosphate N-acetyltransferase GlmU [Thermoanaerobaculia bacterium]